MPKLLPASQVNTEELEAAMSAADEAEALKRFAPTKQPGDLSDGGMVNGVRLTPMQNGRRMEQGRPNARRAWTWNGTETLLPLAWNPEGTTNDGGLPYLRKRHCLCCGTGGFKGRQCLNCVKNMCSRCGSSSDPSKIIALNYTNKDKVPFPARFYGAIPCFLQACIRRDDRGFKTEDDMRVHARSRHKMEYQAHVETLSAARTDEVADLRKRLDAFMLAQVKAPQGDAAPQLVADEERVARPVGRPAGQARKPRAYKRHWTEEQKEAARARYQAARKPAAASTAA